MMLRRGSRQCLTTIHAGDGHLFRRQDLMPIGAAFAKDTQGSCIRVPGQGIDFGTGALTR